MFLFFPPKPPLQILSMIQGPEKRMEILSTVDGGLTAEDMAEEVLHLLGRPPRVQIGEVVVRHTKQKF